MTFHFNETDIPSSSCIWRERNPLCSILFHLRVSNQVSTIAPHQIHSTDESLEGSAHNLFPAMSIRREPTYISTEVWRALRLVAKAASSTEENRIVSVDQLVDELLRRAIQISYPELLEHQKYIDKLDQDQIKKLRPKAIVKNNDTNTQ
jgi:hypothetical protein